MTNCDERKAPCQKCGYNGPGFYQPHIHPCAGELATSTSQYCLACEHTKHTCGVALKPDDKNLEVTAKAKWQSYVDDKACCTEHLCIETFKAGAKFGEAKGWCEAVDFLKEHSFTRRLLELEGKRLGYIK